MPTILKIFEPKSPFRFAKCSSVSTNGVKATSIASPALEEIWSKFSDAIQDGIMDLKDGATIDKDREDNAIQKDYPTGCGDSWVVQGMNSRINSISN